MDSSIMSGSKATKIGVFSIVQLPYLHSKTPIAILTIIPYMSEYDFKSFEKKDINAKYGTYFYTNLQYLKYCIQHTIWEASYFLILGTSFYISLPSQNKSILQYPNSLYSINYVGHCPEKRGQCGFWKRFVYSGTKHMLITRNKHMSAN